MDQAASVKREPPPANGSGSRSPQGRFVPGASGNPAGRPKGARSKAALRLEELLREEIDEIAAKVLELARSGEARILKACLDRLSPVPRGRPLAFALPPLKKVADLPKAAGALLAAVAEGELSPTEASELARLVDAHIRAIELRNVERDGGSRVTTWSVGC